MSLDDAVRLRPRLQKGDKGDLIIAHELVDGRSCLRQLGSERASRAALLSSRIGLTAARWPATRYAAVSLSTRPSTLLTPEPPTSPQQC